MKRIYMAGRLFSEAEVNQRLLEYNLISDFIKDNELNCDIFTPIKAPQNDKSKLPTAEDIFAGDESELVSANVIFADLSGKDLGVAMELGMVLYHDVDIYPYLSDIRLETAGNYDKQYVPYGYNQFVIGGLEKYGHKIYYSFREAFEAWATNELKLRNSTSITIIRRDTK